MASPFLGEIRMFSCDFAPKGWALCNGALLAINQNQALFVLVGTDYGGNGLQTFGLPNLQSSLALHQGTGTGLSTYTIGEPGGVASVTLTSNQIPLHTHTFNAATNAATAAAISTAVVPATPTASGATAYVVSQAADPPLVAQALASGAVAIAGGSQPHSNLMPSLCITFCIALQGIFPTQN
jgi:microcystin-dependent protein